MIRLYRKITILLILKSSLSLNADCKPAQIRIVSFVTITSDRNDSVRILSHWTSFLPDISASILKSNYAKLLARSISVFGVTAADFVSCGGPQISPYVAQMFYFILCGQ